MDEISEIVYEAVKEYIKNHSDRFSFDDQCGSFFIDDKKQKKTFSISIVESDFYGGDDT